MNAKERLARIRRLATHKDFEERYIEGPEALWMADVIEALAEYLEADPTGHTLDARLKRLRELGAEDLLV